MQAAMLSAGRTRSANRYAGIGGLEGSRAMTAWRGKRNQLHAPHRQYLELPKVEMDHARRPVLSQAFH